MIEKIKKNPFTNDVPPAIPKGPQERSAVSITHPLQSAKTLPPSPRSPVPPSPKPPALSPGSESHLVTEYVLTDCTVACQRCLSCWYVEATWSDGSVDLSCYSCRATVTGELFPHLAEERRAEKRKRREAEDAELDRE